MNKVVFRRINGRIIPILAKAAEGAALGVTAGGLVAAIASRRDSKKLEAVINSNQVNTRKFVKNSSVKNVTVLSSSADVNRQRSLNFFRKWQLRSTVKAVGSGNAAVLRVANRDFLIAGKKVNKSTIGHELGHVKDYRSVGYSKYMQKYGRTVLGGTLELEKRAWKLSPVKSKKGMASALRTYERAQNYARVGAAVGAVTAGIIAGMK